MTEDQNKETALVEGSESASEFRGYAQEREKLFRSPFSHNQTLASIGAVFTITHAAETTMEATDMDVKRGIPRGTKIPKFVYTCVSQETWIHAGDNEPDTHYEEGEPFKLAFTTNDIRRNDFERIQELLAKYGKVENLRLQTFKSKKKGMSDAHGIVAAQDWKGEPI